MNYFITFIRQDEAEWCGLVTTDKEYAYKVFEDLCTPPNWNMELRCTEKDIDIYSAGDILDYDVLRYDHSQF